LLSGFNVAIKMVKRLACASELCRGYTCYIGLRVWQPVSRHLNSITQLENLLDRRGRE